MIAPSADPVRPRLLMYAMYDPTSLDSAPKVRITMMARALERIVELERVEGTRTGRAQAGFHWLRHGGLGRIDAIYVESSTSTATPFDLAFLALARLRGRPLGIYFRDAYQLYRELYPTTRLRHRLADLAWRITMPIARRLATIRYAPTSGLASVLRLRRPVLLPPGTDPSLPYLGPGAAPIVGYVGATGRPDGFDRLMDAMDHVRRRIPDARLVVVAPAMPLGMTIPAHVLHVRSSRLALSEALGSTRVCVIPRPINRYTEVALPVKLMDYLAMGKPVVATSTNETAILLARSGAGLVSSDEPEAIAEALIRVIDEEGLAESMSRAARAYACDPAHTWEARATTVVETLIGNAA